MRPSVWMELSIAKSKLGPEEAGIELAGAGVSAQAIGGSSVQ